MAVEYQEINSEPVVRKLMTNECACILTGNSPVVVELDHTSPFNTSLDIRWDHSGVLAGLALNDQNQITGLNNNCIPFAFWHDDPRANLKWLVGFSVDPKNPTIAIAQMVFRAKSGTPLEKIISQGEWVSPASLAVIYDQIFRERIVVPATLRQLLNLIGPDGNHLSYEQLFKSPLVPAPKNYNFLY